MGKRDKSSGKGRLDRFYQLAKEQGYRSRASFKLIQLNKKFEFLQNAHGVIDLCAAPGSWLQVCAKFMPPGGKVIGVDLDKIKKIRGVVTMQEDITTPQCYSRLKREMDGYAVDVVLNDGAPNMGAAWNTDAFVQNELCLHSLRLATEFLRPGGTFVTKVFRSADYTALMYVMKLLFNHVDATKPQASRGTSAEIFVVCREFRNAKIDPRLLDPKYAFKEVMHDVKPRDVFAKGEEKDRRQRQGYEEGNLTQHKVLAAGDFIEHPKPVDTLSMYQEFSFDDERGKLLLKRPRTTAEIVELCKDLRVLGKKDFKALLKWRQYVSKELDVELQAAEAESEAAEAASGGGGGDESSDGEGDGVVRSGGETDSDAMSDGEKQEEKLMDEMESIQRKIAQKSKRERRKKHEEKMKVAARQRMQGVSMNDVQGNDIDLFDINSICAERAGENSMLSRLHDNKQATATFDAEAESDSEAESEESEEGERDDDSDAEGNDGVSGRKYQGEIEDDLDLAYEQYAMRVGEKQAQIQVKEALTDELYGKKWGKAERRKARGEAGQTAHDIARGKTSSRKRAASEISDENTFTFSEDEGQIAPDAEGALTVKFKGGGAENAAALWFEQPMFADMGGAAGEVDDDDDDSSGSESEDDLQASTRLAPVPERHKSQSIGPSASEMAEMSDGSVSDEPMSFGGEQDEKSETESDSDSEAERDEDGYDSETRRAVRLMGPSFLRKKSREELIDAGYNRWAFNDEGLPGWFVDEEKQHNIAQLPITKEQAMVAKEEAVALHTRPIKRIAEARARKKRRESRKMEKNVKRAEAIVDDDSMMTSNKAKAKQVQKVLAKKEVKRSSTYVTVSKGGEKKKVKHKGGGADDASSRTVKVDRRMKSDKRGERSSKKRAKKADKKRNKR